MRHPRRAATDCARQLGGEIISRAEYLRAIRPAVRYDCYGPRDTEPISGGVPPRSGDRRGRHRSHPGVTGNQSLNESRDCECAKCSEASVEILTYPEPRKTTTHTRAPLRLEKTRDDRQKVLNLIRRQPELLKSRRCRSQAPHTGRQSTSKPRKSRPPARGRCPLQKLPMPGTTAAILPKSAALSWLSQSVHNIPRKPIRCAARLPGR